MTKSEIKGPSHGAADASGGASPATQYTGAVLILDALGTRGIWTIENPESIVQSLGRLTRAFKSEVDQGGGRSASQYLTLARLNGLDEPDVQWECQTISDTVIAVARTRASLGAVLLFVALEAIPLMEIGFQAGHPFRGAVATGVYYQAESALIGPAVDEAADWHDKSDWAGVVLTPSAAMELEAVGRNLRLTRGPAFVKHRVPMKDGPLDCYAVNWPLGTVPRTAVEASFRRPPVTVSVARKLANTLSFYDQHHP